MIENGPKYSVVAKTFHWGFVSAFAYGIFKAVEDVDQLEDGSFLKFEVFFASGFLLILGLRFWYMKKTQKSSLPDSTPKLQKFLANLVHLAMYGTLGVIALTGLIIGLIYWIGFEKGVLIELGIVVHELGITIMYWLIAIHISAAIYHRLLRDGVWSSMVPFLKERN